MPIFLSSILTALTLFKRDKWILILSFLPVAIGAAFYFLAGSLIFTDLLGWMNEYFSGMVNVGQTGSTIIEWILTGLLSIIFFFVVNFTFVLLVSILSSPFNDMISSRVEAALGHRQQESIGVGIKFMLKNIFKTLSTEIKKVLLILIISILNLILGIFIPPMGIIISALLLSVSFIDYSWARHDLGLRECIKNYKNGLFSYGIGGLVFMFLISLPVVNLFALPFAVIHFTVNYVNICKRSLNP